MLSATTGYLATSKWIGYTLDSGHTYQKKYVTISNVDYNGYPVNILFGFSVEDIHAFSSDTLLVSGDYGLEPSILYSVNGGDTWKVVFHRNIPINTVNIFNAVWQMDFPGNGSVGFAVHGDQVLKTSNRGQSWQVALEDINKELFDIAFVSPTTGYAAGPNRLWKTTNAGGTWSQLNVTFNIRELAAFGNTIFVNTDLGDNFYSTNGGTGWTAANTEIGQTQLDDMHFVNDTLGYGASHGIYLTKNRGKTWEKLPGSFDSDGNGYAINRLFFLNDQLGWACTWAETLLLTSNAGGTPAPRALFDANTNTVCSDNTVRLLNQGFSGYSYQWFRNGTPLATTYDASYIVTTGSDVIKLVVSNDAGATDTLEQTVDAAGNNPLTLNAEARLDTVCSGGVVYVDIYNSRPDVAYSIGRPCCGVGGTTFGNGSTLTLGAGTLLTEDSSSTFYITAYLNGPCGTETVTSSHTVRIVRSDPPTESIVDTICTQNLFYIKIPNTLPGYQYWADPSFAKVNGTGGTIELPCRVEMASSSFVISNTDDLLINYRFPIYVWHGTTFCGGMWPVTEATMIARNSRAQFEVNGYEWFTGTNLSLENQSKQAETYLWKFPGGASVATHTATNPTDVNYTEAGHKVVNLLAYTKEGCVDSSHTVRLEILTNTGTPGAETVCPTSAPGNAVDSLTGRQYFTSRTMFEDQYGSRVVAGGYTDMTWLNGFYPRGYEGWYAAKYLKNGELAWRLDQAPGDDFSTFNRNSHIVIEQATGDSLGYTYLLGHALNRRHVTAPGQDEFPIPRSTAFIVKVSPAGRILWVKSISNRPAFNDDPSYDYTGGSLLAGKNGDLYIVTHKAGGQRFYFGNDELYDYFTQPQTGVILHIDKDGNLKRKRTFPITFNNLRRFSIYESDCYDRLPPAVWDATGKLVVYGELNPAETTGNAIDGVNISFNTTNIRSALISFDTASLQATAIRPIFKSSNNGDTTANTETFALDAAGNYYVSYTGVVSIPGGSTAYDSVKPKTYIRAFSNTGTVLWTRQAEGLQPRNMVASNGYLKVAGSNYTLSGFTNGAMQHYPTLSPTYFSVKKMTAVGDPGSSSVSGNYGLGSFDITVATFQADNGNLTKLSQLGSTKEDEWVTMCKGFGDQVWVTGIVGGSVRNVLNFVDTASTLKTYKLAIDNNCAATYSAAPSFVALDLIPNKQYCLDSTIRVYWSASNLNNLTLSYSTDGGANYTQIATGLASTPSYRDFNALQAGLSGRVKFRIEAPSTTYSDTVTVYVYPKVTPSVEITTPTPIICSGNSATFTAVPTHGGPSPTYRWYVNGGLTNIETGTFTWSFFNNNETVQARLYTSAPCAVSPNVFSNVITITMGTTTVPSVTITGDTAVTAGQSTTITAASTNGGTTPAYQWQDSTSAHNWQNIAGATLTTINYQPANTGDKLRCQMTSSIACATPATVTSNAMRFRVNTVTAVDPVPGDRYGIHLYPNPASGIVFLDTLRSSDRWETLEVVSIDGKQKLLSMVIRNQSRVSFDVSKLSAGVYIALLSRKSGETVYIRFVKR